MAPCKHLDFGDTVRLTIGGPLMSVLSVSDEECCCLWFSDGPKLEHGRFELDVLELVESGPRRVWSAHQGAAIRAAFGVRMSPSA